MQRVPEETGNETEKEEGKEREKEQDGEEQEKEKVATTERELATGKKKGQDGREQEKEEAMAAGQRLTAVDSEGEKKEEEERRREAKKEQKKIVVIQREPNRGGGDEEKIQEERRKEQWESVRRRELVSEDRRKAEELGEKIAEELEVVGKEENEKLSEVIAEKSKAAAKEKETRREADDDGDEPRRGGNEEMEGVMDYLRQMDRKLREISNKVDELEEERRKERIPRRDVSQESGSSDDSNQSAWELRDGSWFLRIGPKRMNSRQRRKIWRSVKISMEMDEKEREMRKNAHESRRMRSNPFRPGGVHPSEKWAMRKVTVAGTEETATEAKAYATRERGTLNGFIQVRPRIVSGFPAHCGVHCDPSSSSGNRRFM